MGNNREELIKALAGSMGMTGQRKKEESSFDPTTGTLFIGSRVFQPNEIAAAKNYHRENKERMAALGDGAESFYEIAEAAIEMLEKKSVSSGGKLVIQGDLKA